MDHAPRQICPMFVLKDYKDSWDEGPPGAECRLCEPGPHGSFCFFPPSNSDARETSHTSTGESLKDASTDETPKKTTLSPETPEFIPNRHQVQSLNASPSLRRGQQQLRINTNVGPYKPKRRSFSASPRVSKSRSRSPRKKQMSPVRNITGYPPMPPLSWRQPRDQIPLVHQPALGPYSHFSHPSLNFGPPPNMNQSQGGRSPHGVIGDVGT